MDDVAAAGADVRPYIGTEIRALLDDPDFIEALGLRKNLAGVHDRNAPRRDASSRR